MSGNKFNGFSDKEILKISSKTVKMNTDINRITRKLPDSKATIKTKQPQNPPEIVHENINNNISIDLENNNPFQEAMYFKPLPKITTLQDESILPTPEIINSDDEIQVNDNMQFKGISLKDFEIQRKIIEEQNKQKKDLLYRTIEQHTERTSAEVKKLQDVKKELSKLDSELASDVSIIRKQIESASIQYMQIQKQYQYVETLFLKAKLDLHNASEKKELLTEHLCTIIAHNENRKAKKLSELMEKVGLSLTNIDEESNK